MTSFAVTTQKDSVVEKQFLLVYPERDPVFIVSRQVASISAVTQARVMTSQQFFLGLLMLTTIKLTTASSSNSSNKYFSSVDQHTYTGIALYLTVCDCDVTGIESIHI